MAAALKRVYMMKDSDLAMLASNLVVIMNRDAAEFAARGVNAADIAAFKDLGNAFELIPDDKYYFYLISESVERKNKKRREIEEAIREITGLAKVKWGARSAELRRFDAAGIYSEDQKKFLTTASHVLEVATAYLSELSKYGLTQEKLDALEEDIDEFESELNKITELKSQRQAKTEERIAMGNELFALVSRYCTLGKIIWQDKDYARYNDYLIYKNKNRKAAK